MTILAFGLTAVGGDKKSAIHCLFEDIYTSKRLAIGTDVIVEGEVSRGDWDGIILKNARLISPKR